MVDCEKIKCMDIVTICTFSVRVAQSSVNEDCLYETVLFITVTMSIWSFIPYPLVTIDSEEIFLQDSETFVSELGS